MAKSPQVHHVFPDVDLLPPQWIGRARGEELYVYNPAVACFRGRRLMAYRVDSAPGRPLFRRIALCVLDDHWRAVPGSAIPFSDTIREGGDLHYDPRLVAVGDRLLLHYNNNYQSRPNRLYLVEVDGDSLTARSPARRLELDGRRLDIEKNWMLFAHEGELLAVYSIAPHTVLRIPLAGGGPIACRREYTVFWDVSGYAEKFGLPCGGTSPVRSGETYWSFFHSHRQVGWLGNPFYAWSNALIDVLPRQARAFLQRMCSRSERRRYYAGVYAFAAHPPFAPLWLGPGPVLRPEAEAPRRRPPMNPIAEGVVYPCGALPRGDAQWLLSYGVHDERCVLRSVDVHCDHARVQSGGMRSSPSIRQLAAAHAHADDGRLARG
jgi:hypothetical protein